GRAGWAPGPVGRVVAAAPPARARCTWGGADVSVDGLERPHDLPASGLQEGREHHLLAERGRVLVHREAGALRRDLEEHAVRLAQVEAAEPVAVHGPAVRDAG